jgi:hypothetical protein
VILRRKFLRRAVVLEAEQFFSTSLPWPTGVKAFHDCTPAGCTSWGLACIETLEGTMIVRDGDWIVTGVKGEKYPVREDIFAELYAEITEEN